jgi:hypothetical protein
MASRICYRGLHRYKYQLMETYRYETGFSLPRAARTAYDYVVLETNGTLTVKKGYAWDGPSGPTLDTRNFMRASLVHDALYQLMRENLVGDAAVRDAFRRDSDTLLRRIVRKDGMTWPRHAWVYLAVRWFGRKATDRQDPPPNVYAP